MNIILTPYDHSSKVPLSRVVIVLLAIAGVFAAIGAITFATLELRVKTPGGS